MNTSSIGLIAASLLLAFSKRNGSKSAIDEKTFKFSGVLRDGITYEGQVWDASSIIIKVYAKNSDIKSSPSLFVPGDEYDHSYYGSDLIGDFTFGTGNPRDYGEWGDPSFCTDPIIRLEEKFGEHPFIFEDYGYLQSGFRGYGIAKQVYNLILEIISKSSKQPFYFCPDTCKEGATSEDMMRVWKSLSKKYINESVTPQWGLWVLYVKPSDFQKEGIEFAKTFKIQKGSVNEEISYQDSYSVLSKFPPHDVENVSKFEEIYESIKKDGWKGRPLICLGNQLLTGSHRYHALLKLFQHDDLEIEVPVIDIEPYLTESEISHIEDSIDQEDILNILKSSKVPEGIISIYLQDFDLKKGSANKPKRKKKFIVRSPEQGLKVIQHKDITDNWKKSLRVRPKHRVAVLLPCAATKPFAESPSHKYGYLKALSDKDVDLYVVSEPLGIIPYAWQDKYPNADYDYPPKYLKGKARKLLSERIGEWFKKVYPKYNTVYSALPGHHQKLVNDSTDAKLKKVTINECRNDTCSDSVFRATAGEYVNYLRRNVK